MLKRSRPELSDGCISDLMLDQLRAEEMPARAAAAVLAHLQTCPRCQERKLTLDRQTGEIAAQLPAFVPRGAATGRTDPSRGRSFARSHRGWLSAVMVAACALLVAWPDALEDSARRYVTRSKGSPSLYFYVKRGDHVFEGADGQKVMPGDQLRFLVTPQSYTYVAILGRTADARTSLYYPQRDAVQAMDPHGVRTPLDAASELDDVLSDETIYAVFCSHPPAIDQLQAQLARGGGLHDTGDCDVRQLSLHKVAQP
ncbi:MAG: hypothetical protein JWN04_3052 [Myxococcaceae bacterium]|nr:hypothetical protein [Myxococcaceae bacterium]